MNEGRVCTKCKVFKEYSQFHRTKKVKSGYESRCKECSNEELRAYRQKNREKVRANERKYYHQTREKRIRSCKEYQKRNVEKIKAYRRKTYELNKEYFKQKHIIWYQENKEHANQKAKTWYQNNKDKAYTRVLKRRSLKHSVNFNSFERKEILDRDDWTCQLCGVTVHDRKEGGWNDEFKAHLDHIIPISKGGDSTPENIQVLCRTCNLRKNDNSDLILVNGQVQFEI